MKLFPVFLAQSDGREGFFEEQFQGLSDSGLDLVLDLDWVIFSHEYTFI